MPRIVALVDGFNLYHSLQNDQRLHYLKWLDIDKLIKTYFPRGTEKIVNFTPPTHWGADNVARHKVLIRALEATGIEMVYGKFKDRDRTWPLWKRSYKGKKSKLISILPPLFRMAYEKKFDTAVLLTGDSDQLPTFWHIHQCFPGLKLGVILPVGREAAELKIEADFYLRAKGRTMAKCLFDRPLKLADGTLLECPPGWE